MYDNDHASSCFTLVAVGFLIAALVAVFSTCAG
jgi:hypothetical protein